MDDLELINKFTRKNMTFDELYMFDVVLCDNKIDRDFENFSLKSLESLKKLFVGKTGIFDHDTKSENQTARIYDTSIETSDETVPETGENYTQLKAKCYMVKTASNADLIKEIDGGIKKEVSVSCMCLKKICSICGRDKMKNPCNHIAGKIYGGKRCHFTLDDVSDAYEWSFVAVPSQRNAGITKHFGNIQETQTEDLKPVYDSIKSDIVRFCYLNLDKNSQDILIKAADNMDLNSLVDLKNDLIKKSKLAGSPQLKSNYNINDYKI